LKVIPLPPKTLKGRETYDRLLMHRGRKRHPVKRKPASSWPALQVQELKEGRTTKESPEEHLNTGRKNRKGKWKNIKNGYAVKLNPSNDVEKDPRKHLLLPGQKDKKQPKEGKKIFLTEEANRQKKGNRIIIEQKHLSATSQKNKDGRSFPIGNDQLRRAKRVKRRVHPFTRKPHLNS